MVRFASRVDQREKAPRISSGALLCRAKDALINNFNKVRFARADHALGVRKAVHVNCDPASVHEYKVRISDQPEMARSVSLDEELFRMPPKTDHLGMTRYELFLVHRRRLIPVYVMSATLNVRLSTYVRA